MNELICLNCNIPYSDLSLKRCLLCGGNLTTTQTVVEAPKSKKVKKIEKQLEATQVEDGTVPSFDDTGGFSERTTPEGLVIGQLKADEEALEKRLDNFEGIYKKEHPKGRSWYASFGTWFVILLVLGMCYMVYWFIETQGGLPTEFYDVIRRIRTWINW